MKKIIAVAALVAASFAAPALPTQAATMEAADANCVVFPMFKRECWEQAHAWAAERHAAVHAAVSAEADGLDEMNPPKVPVEWWNCTRAAEGSGHLLDC